MHRMQVAEKINRHVAILSTAIHMSKSLATASSLVLYGGKGDVSVLEICALGFMTLALVTVFVYNSVGEKSNVEVSKHISQASK